MSAMSTAGVRLSQRDHDVLRLLDRTPVTAALILKASECFSESFDNLRRVRERLEALTASGWVRCSPMASTSRRVVAWYQLTPAAFRMLYGADAVLPHKTFFLAVPPSRQEHTLWLAEVIVQTMVAANRSLMSINDYRRENSVVLTLGSETLKPDGSLQLESIDRRQFNFFVELDNGTEPVRSRKQRENVQRKIRFYERLQDAALAAWKRGPRAKPPPRYRVLFFLQSRERIGHILEVARATASNPDRHLCLCVPLDSYLCDRDPLRAPLAVDHHGRNQPLITDDVPASPRLPLELRSPAASLAAVT